MADPRVAVVTGANRGIGQAIAAELLRNGLRVLATSRTPQPAHAVLDVARPESVDEFVASIRGEPGVDCLVNNAAVSLDGFHASVVAATLEVNFFGALRVTDALLPRIKSGGCVVMVSSGMGTLSHVGAELRARFQAPSLTRSELIDLMRSFVRDVAEGSHARHGWPSNAYSVSKVGLNALVRVLARELEDDPRRIRVNAADPGWVRTRMGGPGAPRSVERGARTPVWLANLPDDGPTGGFFRDEKPTPF